MIVHDWGQKAVVIAPSSAQRGLFSFWRHEPMIRTLVLAVPPKIDTQGLDEYATKVAAVFLECIDDVEFPDSAQEVLRKYDPVTLANFETIDASKMWFADLPLGQQSCRL